MLREIGTLSPDQSCASRHKIVRKSTGGAEKRARFDFVQTAKNAPPTAKSPLPGIPRRSGRRQA
jgi:hypothetical protein